MNQKPSRSWLHVVRSLAYPIVIGLAAFITFIVLINAGFISSPTVHRYIMGHPVSQLTAAMFCVGLVALGIAARDIVVQFIREPHIHLNVTMPFNQPRTNDSTSNDKNEATTDPEEKLNRDQATAETLLEHIEQMPERKSSHFLWNRLQNALRFIRHNHGSDGLDEHLRTLAEEDEINRVERYSLVKILIWATPMLGFLGTVIGISEALGGIGGGDFQQMMDRLKSSLYVAFDTTALALTFSIILMFVQFVVDRFETQLLSDVDSRSREELGKHYQSFGASVDANLLPVHRLGRMIMTANHELVQHQVELWQKSIGVAQSAWIDAAQQSQQTIEEKLSKALDRSAEHLAAHVQTTVTAADEKLEKRWEQWQVQFSDNARMLREHQEQILKQTKMVEQVVAATGEVVRLQDALDKNLSSLANSNHFEDAVANLSAVIHLLNNRLGHVERDAKKNNLRIVPHADEQGSTAEDAA